MTDINPDIKTSHGERSEGFDQGPDLEQTVLKELGEIVNEFFPEGMAGTKKSEKSKLEEGLTKLIKQHGGDPSKIDAGAILDEIINAGLPQLPPPKLANFEQLLEELAGDIGGVTAKRGGGNANKDIGGFEGFAEAAKKSGAAKWLSTSYMAVMLEVILDNIEVQKEIKLTEGLHEAKMIETIAQNVVAVADMIMEVAEKEAEKFIIQRNASIAKAAIGFAGVANTVASPVAAKITSKVKGMADKQMTRARQNIEQKYANYQFNKGQKMVEGATSQSQIDKGYKLMESNYAKAGRADDFKKYGLSQQAHYTNNKFSNEGYTNQLKRQETFENDVKVAKNNRTAGNEEANHDVVRNTPPNGPTERNMSANEKIKFNQDKIDKAKVNSADTDKKLSKEQKQLAALQKARYKAEADGDTKKQENLDKKIDKRKEKIEDLEKSKESYENKIAERRGNIDKLIAYGGNQQQIESRRGQIEGDTKAMEPGMSQIEGYKHSSEFTRHVSDKLSEADSDRKGQEIFNKETGNLDGVAQKKVEENKRWEGKVDQEQHDVEQRRKNELHQIDANSSQREMEDLRMMQELNRQSTEGINSVIDAAMYNQLAANEIDLGEAKVGEQAAQAVLQANRTERERTHESKRAASEQINDLVQGYKSFIQAYHQATGFGKSFTTQ